MALSVPLSRFTPRVGGGSAFFVRRIHTITIMRDYYIININKTLTSNREAILDLKEQLFNYTSSSPTSDITFLTLEDFDVPILKVFSTERDIVFLTEPCKGAVSKETHIPHGSPFRTKIATRPRVSDTEQRILTEFPDQAKKST